MRDPTRPRDRLSKAPQPLEMYEGRLRGRPKPSDDVELPLRGSGLTNRKRERASRYSDDKPEASPEGAARTLRKARPADRRWLRKALRQADAEGADLDVLLGAEEQIRNGAPQLAITTYHVDVHAERMIAWLREIRPDYSLRLKGFSFWTDKPRPVLLQASTLP